MTPRLSREDGDTVVDPFAGSNTTGVVAESLQRLWIAMERVPEYLEASRVRFERLYKTDTQQPARVQPELF